MPNTPHRIDDRNFGTRCASVYAHSPVEPEGQRTERILAEAAYRAALELRWSKRVDAPGAWLAVYRHRNGWHGEVLNREPWSALTVGRHDKCTARLDPRQEVSLRHVLLRTLPAGGGPGEIEVVDLRSGGGVRVVRGGKSERMALRGPVVLLASGQPIAVVPMDGQLPDSIPNPDVVNTMPPPRSRRAPSESSFATLGTLVGAGPRRTQDPERGALLGWFCLVNHRRQRADLALYEDDLSRGVLLGRYARCDSRVGGLDLPNSLSRVHAFAVRDGDGVRVYDTASTNGIGAGPRFDEALPALRFSLNLRFRFWLGADLQVAFQPT